jgi:hypothetical protein
VSNDTTPPSVSITAPAGGATVTGTLPVTASASDNVAVAGVQFKLDGANLGAEDTTSPYSISWDTTTAADGSHTLTAAARDGAGNATTSAGVNVTVANGTVRTLAPQDTFIGLDATNQSTNPQLMTYTWPDNKVANAILMKFDLSAIPAAAVVADATLQLSLVGTDAAPESTYTVTAHKVVGKNLVISAATGYMANGVTAWTANTCCDSGVPLAQADISAAYDTRAIDKTLGYKSWSITALAQEWVANPTTNFGLLLNSDTSKLSDRYRTFASMENANPSLRPYLRITYSVVPDVTPPLISAVLASAITPSAATITWTTNEPSDSQVEYGTTTGYGSLGTLNASLVIAHVATLSGLAPNTLYHYRVRSRDFAGNLAISGDFTFTTLALDLTPPTVSITAPSGGATVTGTVTVTASASDNVAVVGVQFKRGGANLGAEDTTSPYSVSWNTAGVANGSHTLTAVARDAAGNSTTSAGVAVTVSNTTSGTGIAALYPGDVGIETHPDVVFTEMFEQSSISNLTSRYDDVANSGGMAFTTSIPAGSGGSRSLQMTSVVGSSESTGLYKMFSPGNGDQWYLRYYVNYNSSVVYGHTGTWLGGYNPPLTYPNPQAGVRPDGDDRFSIGPESDSANSDRWMSYTYWKGMRISGGTYWGNVLLNEAAQNMARNRWYCVEAMVKLNNPVSDYNGELAIWMDGQKILHMGKGFPMGTWSGGRFTPSSSGTLFEGFQWRSDPALLLNYIWLQNYVNNSSSGSVGKVMFDHLVLAKSRVGCLASGSSDTTAPTVSLSAPTAGATVSGTAVTVSASASDNVGVAGVQFKLNGVNLGSEVTVAPYSLSWDTTTAIDGSHPLTAVARDGAGNTATSTGVTVTVSNASGTGILFESNWATATGNSSTAILDGGRWNELDVGGTVAANPNEMVVVNMTAPHGLTRALRVQQQGSGPNAWSRVAKFNFTPPSSDYYLRYYYRTDDVAGTAGSHVVQYSITNYGDLVYLSQLEYAAGWSIRLTLGAYNAPNDTMPNWQLANPTALAYGRWYRIEYRVHFTAVNRIRVYIRIYDDTDALVFTEMDFIADPDWGQWTGATLASYYAGTNPGVVTDFKVTPSHLVNMEFGNNGSASARNTGLYWYFAGVKIRGDTWPGP